MPKALLFVHQSGGFLNDKKEIIPVIGKIDSTVIGLCKKRQKRFWTWGNGFFYKFKKPPTDVQIMRLWALNPTAIVI